MRDFGELDLGHWIYLVLALHFLDLETMAENCLVLYNFFFFGTSCYRHKLTLGKVSSSVKA